MSMIQPISGAAVQASLALTGVKEASAVRQQEAQAPEPVVDEYVPEEKQEPSGLYWPERDEDGQLKVHYDAPEKAESCTGNTDAVDREIEALRKEKESLEQQLASQADETKRAALEQKLAQVEQELNQKDNDSYRRQHTVFS